MQMGNADVLLNMLNMVNTYFALVTWTWAGALLYLAAFAYHI
jgi:hypothetical protein